MEFLVVTIICLGSVWGLVHGLLKCLWPSRFYAFWKWYSSFGFGGPMVQEVPLGPHIRLRVVGFIIIVTCIFFAYQASRLIVKIASQL